MSVENIKREEEFEELMDVDEAEVDDCYEDGEIYSDEEKDVNIRISIDERNIFTRGQPTGLSASNKDEILKKLNRAKRFSIPFQNSDKINGSRDDLWSLYRDLGIDKENERHYRFNSIHIRGTGNMGTKDVLKYFEPFKPSYVEWINDISCNAVWMDDVITARALLNLSTRIKNLNKIHSNSDPFGKDDTLSDDGEGVDARSIKTAIPPGYWRLGVPCKKSQYLLLRYATKSDRKQKNAEKNSEYYRKYGNPNYDNIPGLISNSLKAKLRKQRYWQDDSLRDGKERKIDTKNPWEDLAYEWGKGDKVEDNYDKKPKNFDTRLSKPYTPDLRISLSKRKAKRLRAEIETSLNTDAGEIWEGRSKVPRMAMYADDEERKFEKYVTCRSHSKFPGQPIKDLRSKINSRKKGAKGKFRFKKKGSAVYKDFSVFENEDEDEDDGDSGEWALEQYHDLRESLGQNKKSLQKRNKFVKYESESEEDLSDFFKERDFSCRSPLQVEIENDECYLNRST